MTDRQGDQDPEPTAPTNDVRQGRRAFLRRLPNDAVTTAGRFAGLTSIVGRTVVAAGEAAVRDLAPATAEEATTNPASPSTAADVTEASSAPPAPASAAPATVATDPALALTPEQHDFLANGAQAALAVNDPASAPHITSSVYRWDGATIRLPGEASTARALHIDRDPRVSLLVDDPLSEAWVALTGVASLVYDEVEREMLLILAKYLTEDGALRRWEEMRAGGIPIVIVVRPTRFVWRPA